MIARKLNDIEVGDILQRVSDQQYYDVKSIIKVDNEERDLNFGFEGFFVKGKLMKNFFVINNSKEFRIFNKALLENENVT